MPITIMKKICQLSEFIFPLNKLSWNAIKMRRARTADQHIRTVAQYRKQTRYESEQ